MTTETTAELIEWLRATHWVPRHKPVADALEAAQAEVARLERRDKIMFHDYPALQQFHAKHAVGPLAAPSCLCCGQSTQGVELGAQHLELPGVVICMPCKLAAAGASPVQPSHAVELSDGEITEIAKTACAEGRLLWLGFGKDEDGQYTVPILSPSDFKLVREVIAALNAKGLPHAN